MQLGVKSAIETAYLYLQMHHQPLLLQSHLELNQVTVQCHHLWLRSFVSHIRPLGDHILPSMGSDDPMKYLEARRHQLQKKRLHIVRLTRDEIMKHSRKPGRKNVERIARNIVLKTRNRWETCRLAVGMMLWQDSRRIVLTTRLEECGQPKRDVPQGETADIQEQHRGWLTDQHQLKGWRPGGGPGGRGRGRPWGRGRTEEGGGISKRTY